MDIYQRWVDNMPAKLRSILGMPRKRGNPGNGDLPPLTSGGLTNPPRRVLDFVPQLRTTFDCLNNLAHNAVKQCTNIQEEHLAINLCRKWVDTMPAKLRSILGKQRKRVPGSGDFPLTNPPMRGWPRVAGYASAMPNPNTGVVSTRARRRLARLRCRAPYHT